MTVTIYHNPRCGKSRAALELIRARDGETTVVEYLKTTPDTQELERIVTMLGIEPRDLMRKQETAYKENGLDNPSLSRMELIAAMVEHPILIERPIVIKDGRAVIGRPPERVLEIL
jgi:arsenate reductase (glutaredoxin)